MQIFHLQISGNCLSTWSLQNVFGEGHHIFSKHGIEEIVNLQPKGTKAKPYQVKQVRKLIVRYKLGASDGL